MLAAKLDLCVGKGKQRIFPWLCHLAWHRRLFGQLAGNEVMRFFGRSCMSSDKTNHQPLLKMLILDQVGSAQLHANATRTSAAQAQAALESLDTSRGVEKPHESSLHSSDVTGTAEGVAQELTAAQGAAAGRKEGRESDAAHAGHVESFALGERSFIAVSGVAFELAGGNAVLCQVQELQRMEAGIMPLCLQACLALKGTLCCLSHA